MFRGDERWQGLKVPEGETFTWDEKSTYVKNPPYFENMPKKPAAVGDISGARVLCFLGNSVTTDHISPAGSIKHSSPAGQYLIEHGVQPVDFNSYGSRRGNHEVMMRGTFANVRLRNKLTPEREGAYTRHLPDGKEMFIYDASVQYRKEGTPLMVLAGKEYGSGSSRDWAAKGPRLLGVRVALAESFERIHRSNLVGMGILPLQFLDDENAETSGLTGEEVYDIVGLTDVLANFAPGQDGEGAGEESRWHGHGVRCDGENRYSAGSAVLPARRDFAVCVAAVVAKLTTNNSARGDDSFHVGSQGNPSTDVCSAVLFAGAGAELR